MIKKKRAIKTKGGIHDIDMRRIIRNGPVGTVFECLVIRKIQKYAFIICRKNRRKCILQVNFISKQCIYKIQAFYLDMNKFGNDVVSTS